MNKNLKISEIKLFYIGIIYIIYTNWRRKYTLYNKTNIYKNQKY